MNKTIKQSKVALSKRNAEELIQCLQNDYIPRCDALLKKDYATLQNDGTYQSLIEYVQLFLKEKKKAVPSGSPSVPSAPTHASASPVNRTSVNKAASRQETTLKALYLLNQQRIMEGQQSPLIVVRKTWDRDYCVFVTKMDKGRIIGRAYIAGKPYQPYWMKPENDNGYAEYYGPSRELIIETEKELMKQSIAMQPVEEKDSCDKCIYAKKGDCCSTKLCKDYFPVDIPKDVMNNWPKYGDATAIRLGLPKSQK